MQENTAQPDVRLQDNPLESHLQTLATSLVEDGYADVTVRSKLGLLADFGRWFGQTGLTVAHLDERHVDALVKGRQQVRRGDLKTLDQFLDHLRKRDVVPARKLICDTFRHFNFVIRHAPTMAVKRAQLMTTAFRSFFGYLFQKGELPADLAASVPTVADWRLSTVPKYLASEEVGRVLKACNRRTATGRRNCAVLLLLARLSLRAGEVVALQLDDFNWRTGEIMVRGKGLRMPLPSDVGQALASYRCRDRPSCRTRRLFVCMKAPRRGFAGHSILTTIVRRALDRADLHPPSRELTCSVTVWLLPCSALGRPREKSEKFVGIAFPTRQKSTPRLTSNGLRSLAHPWPIGGGQ